MYFLKYEFKTKLVNYVYYSIFLIHILVWLYFGIHGYELLYYIFRNLTFFIFPIGLYLILYQHYRIYFNSFVILREENFNKNFILTTILHTLVYAICIACMSIFISMNMTDVNAIIQSIPSLLMTVVMYLLGSIIYLLLLITKIYKLALIIPLLLMVSMTFINYEINIFNFLFYGDIMQILGVWVFLFCIMMSGYVLLIRKVKKEELYVEKI